MSAIDGYYIQNGLVFREGHEQLQKDAQMANAFGTSLLAENDQAYQRSLRNWVDASEIAGSAAVGTVEVLADPWFWVTVILIDHHHWHMPHQPHYGGGSGCGASNDCSGCSGGGDADGKACLAALLIIAIAALVIAALALIGFAGYEANESDKIRQKINEIKKQQDELQEESEAAKKVYNEMLPILREKYASKITETLSTVTIVVGVSFLTTAAIFALYAIINGVPVSPLASPFAIAGGSVIGAGLLAHVIRPIVRLALSEKQMKQYQKLHEALQECRKAIVHPNAILRESGEEKAYLRLNNRLFLKVGDRFYEKDSIHEGIYLDEGYTKIEINDRSAT